MSITFLDKKCKLCGVNFKVRKGFEYIKYCSRECYYNTRKSNIEKNKGKKKCLFCGNMFKYSKNSLLDINRKFCNMDCYNKFRQESPHCF